MAKRGAEGRALEGEVFTYSHPDGLGYGEFHRGEPLTAEMTELDLIVGTDVTVLVPSDDAGWIIVSWVDSKGLDRNTAIEPQFFADNFTGPI